MLIDQLRIVHMDLSVFVELFLLVKDMCESTYNYSTIMQLCQTY